MCFALFTSHIIAYVLHNNKHILVDSGICISAFLTSAFILHNYHVSDREVVLINYSESDSEMIFEV